MIGQYEDFDTSMWESWTPGSEISVDVFDLPSDYVDTYSAYYDPATNSLVLPSGVASNIASAATSSGSSFLDIIKSVLGIAAPVVTAALTADQKTAALQAAAQKVATQSAGLTGSLTGMLSSLTSNLPLLAVIGLGAYFLFGRKGGSSGGGRKYRTKRKKGRR